MLGEQLRYPLEGLKVIDLTRFLSGPYCTMILADLGAEVIKVESLSGDPARDYPPHVGTSRKMGGYFASLNRNKKSIAINLKAEEGKDILMKLVEKSDVLVENFKPGVMKRLGLDYEVLKEVNPRLIYASVNGFGSPELRPSLYWNRPAYDLIVQAMGGVMSMTGPEGGQPTKVGPGLGDVWPALLLAIGILSALRYRDLTGKGQRVEVAMLDGMLYLIEGGIVVYSYIGHIPKPEGNHHRLLAPYGAFKAKDGLIVIATGTREQWEKLCKVIGREDLINHPKLKTWEQRKAHLHDLLIPAIEKWLEDKTKEEACKILLNAGLAAAPVYNVKDIFENPHINQRGMLVDIDIPLVGRKKIAGVPITFSRTPCSIRLPPPLIGEHSEEILTSLGYTRDEISRLRKRNILI